MQCVQCRTVLDLHGEEQLVEVVSALGGQDHDAQQRESAAVLANLEESVITLNEVQQRGRFAGGGPRGLEDSFVVLAKAAKRQSDPSTEDAPARRIGAGPMAPQQGDDVIAASAYAFKLATTATQVEHPLCEVCCRGVQEEMEKDMEALREEAEAYEAALERLQADAPTPASVAELALAQQQERAERKRAEQAEAELATEERRLASLQVAAGEVAELEGRYWRAANQLELQLSAHLQERDSILAKIDVASAQLESLQRTNVWNDVFHIWKAGPFATVNGARLGRLGEANVTWEEINAAWGHCVLLLHTMAQVCKFTFSSYRLLPMGSFARITHKGVTHDLYGPANRWFCTSYDGAQIAFLACLKEFAEFARKKDLAEGRTPFEMPHAIEGDKVGGLTIKLCHNKDAKWTKALKYMAADLKWAMKWVVTVHDIALAASLRQSHMAASRAASAAGSGAQALR